MIYFHVSVPVVFTSMCSSVILNVMICVHILVPNSSSILSTCSR